MRIYSRALLIISVFFLIRLGFSCCNCVEQVAEYQFDSIEITNIDNSEWTANHSDYNKMYPTAVAFRVNVADTSFRGYYEMAQVWSPKLPSAMAMQPCECPFHFFLKNEISKVSVITLRDISPDKTAGSDIADSFVWQQGWNHMYQSVDSLLNIMNKPFYDYRNPQKSIQFYCRDSVQNDSLQLVFQFQYTNGEMLSDTTELISILLSGEEGRL